mgnify:FL=1|uniref:Uncharacterized protein n=1 Tax=viral metagenome TaxID=1070528 RepID=A0A6C0L0N2_9ZZZZ
MYLIDIYNTILSIFKIVLQKIEINISEITVDTYLKHQTTQNGNCSAHEIQENIFE